MKHLWIIDKLSSNPLFYHSYTKLGLDSNLVSTLLTVLNTFSEVELQSVGVTYLEMSGYRWVYYDVKADWNLLFIAAGDKEANPQIMRSQLEVIFPMFVEKYNLTPKMIREGISRTDIFNNFRPVLDELQEQWNQATIYYEAAKIFDLLGFFQQLFYELQHIIEIYFKEDERQKIFLSILRFWEPYRKSEILSQNPEFTKITFDMQNGWSILTINPKKVELDIVRNILMNITIQIKNILVNHIDIYSSVIFNIEIIPFLLTEYDLLHNLQINKKLLEIFGAVPRP